MPQFLKLSECWLNVDQIRAVKIPIKPGPAVSACLVIFGSQNKPAGDSSISLRDDDVKILLEFLERNRVNEDEVKHEPICVTIMACARSAGPGGRRRMMPSQAIEPCNPRRNITQTALC